MPLQEAYDRLFAAYGPQSWWPAETRFEVMVGAVLVQNTAWGNVERAVANLKAAGLLSPQPLYDAPLEELEQHIRPSGVYRVKARRLRELVALVVERYGGSLDAMFQSPSEELRNELLALNGIGPETADCILLYAAGRPAFVIDAYTRRVLERHGWAEAGISYDELKSLFESHLPRDAQLFNEYHALLVEVGKRHCRKVAVCERCPLEEMLPK
ncbi:MAG: endonuclease III domain-containing protein [Planctomycetales bacterium]|nr:endonuclease III domain-containing protein [Planctomycetales bacterium]MCA9239211.1 endonuclease III domain-containing protein [Planctomycetales bacterium]